MKRPMRTLAMTIQSGHASDSVEYDHEDNGGNEDIESHDDGDDVGDGDNDDVDVVAAAADYDYEDDDDNGGDDDDDQCHHGMVILTVFIPMTVSYTQCR